MRRSLVLALVAACGSSPHKVELCATGEALAVYRDGDGPWKQLTANSEGRYELVVSGDYEVVTVYTHSNGLFFASLTASTASETKPIDECPETRVDMPPAVTGGFVGGAADTVFMDSAVEGSSLTRFSLPVTPGTHDLLVQTVASQQDPAGRVVLRRGMTITGPTDVGTIDLTTATPLDLVPVTVTNASGPVTTSSNLRTTINDFASLASSSPMTVGVLPASLLQPTDKQSIAVYTNNFDAYVEVAYPGSTTAFAMPAPLTGITFGAGNTSASWTSLPAPYGGVDFDALNTSNTGDQLISATKGWLDAHHTTSLSFPTDVPGYQSAWMITSASSAQLDVWNEDGDVTTVSFLAAPGSMPLVEKARRIRASHAAMR